MRNKTRIVEGLSRDPMIYCADLIPMEEITNPPSLIHLTLVLDWRELDLTLDQGFIKDRDENPNQEQIEKH